MTKLARNGIAVVLAAVLAAILLLLARNRLPLTEEGPREVVPGVQGILQPRSTPEQERVNALALDSAAQYAAAHESRALVVTRHGHIVFERYWKGATRDTVIDGGAFHRAIAVMLVGVAQDDRRIGSMDDRVSLYMNPGSAEASGPTIREVLESDDVQPLVPLVEHATERRYAEYLSRKIWRRLSAEDASVMLDRPEGMARADCCLQARIGDWMRIAQLLLADGKWQGTQILPPGWAVQMLTPLKGNPDRGLQVRLGIPRDGAMLSGRGQDRLWLAPALGVAILRVGDETPDWDDARIPAIVLAGVEDRPDPKKESDEQDLSRLVPNH